MHIPPLPVQAQKQWWATPFIPLSMARDALAWVLVALAEITRQDIEVFAQRDSDEQSN